MSAEELEANGDAVLKHPGRDLILQWGKRIKAMVTVYLALLMACKEYHGCTEVVDLQSKLTTAEDRSMMAAETKQAEDSANAIVGIAGFFDWINTYKGQHNSTPAKAALDTCESVVSLRKFEVPTVVIEHARSFIA